MTQEPLQLFVHLTNSFPQQSFSSVSFVPASASDASSHQAISGVPKVPSQNATARRLEGEHFVGGMAFCSAEQSGIQTIFF